LQFNDTYREARLDVGFLGTRFKSSRPWKTVEDRNEPAIDHPKRQVVRENRSVPSARSSEKGRISHDRASQRGNKSDELEKPPTCTTPENGKGSRGISCIISSLSGGDALEYIHHSGQIVSIRRTKAKWTEEWEDRGTHYGLQSHRLARHRIDLPRGRCRSTLATAGGE
jgi:hypothetical protein